MTLNWHLGCLSLCWLCVLQPPVTLDRFKQVWKTYGLISNLALAADATYWRTGLLLIKVNCLERIFVEKLLIKCSRHHFHPSWWEQSSFAAFEQCRLCRAAGPSSGDQWWACETPRAATSCGRREESCWLPVWDFSVILGVGDGGRWGVIFWCKSINYYLCI